MTTEPLPTLSRRAFLGGLAAASAATAFGAEPLPPPEGTLRFLLCSDLHAQDIPDGEERMRAIVAAAQAAQASFILEMGDFVRLNARGCALRALWEPFKGRVFHTLGNHDLDYAAKEDYVREMGMPGRYYAFERGGLRLIVLDGNNLFDGSAYVPYRKGNYRGKPGKAVSHVDAEQLAWLEATLAATDKRCLVFSHQSVDRGLRNGEAVRRVLEAANAKAGFAKVPAVFGGHDHSNYEKTINGIRYVQINSASYIWIGKRSGTERRYPPEINKKYGGILRYSLPYDRALYGIVDITPAGLRMKGVEGRFLPPTPEELGLGDTHGGMPMVPWIRDVEVPFQTRRVSG